MSVNLINRMEDYYIMLKSKIFRMVLCIGLSGILLSGCSISAGGEDFRINVGDNEKERSTDKITLDAASVTSTDIDINVGTVTIGYGKDSNANIDVEYTITGKDEDVLKEILALTKVNAEVKEGELQVAVINKDTNGNIWTWIEKEYKGVNKPNLDVDLDITLPEAAKQFDVTCNVGDINLKELTGTFDISSNVGSIDMNKINFTGDSKITADVGDVSCSLSKDIKEPADVTLTTNIGNVKLDTEDLPYTEEDENNDNFLGKAKTILVNETCKFDVNVSLGDFNLR
jgi:hypothetical protein